MPSNGAIDS
jgi:hypothetical protein